LAILGAAMLRTIGVADRLAEPVDVEQPPRLAFPVVGIGGSAGGIEAFGEFFKAMPADAGMAFVVILHLPPDRESLLADILSKRTSMPVAEVKDGLAVEADHVYVIAPVEHRPLVELLFGRAEEH